MRPQPLRPGRRAIFALLTVALSVGSMVAIVLPASAATPPTGPNPALAGASLVVSQTDALTAGQVITYTVNVPASNGLFAVTAHLCHDPGPSPYTDPTFGFSGAAGIQCVDAAHVSTPLAGGATYEQTTAFTGSETTSGPLNFTVGTGTAIWTNDDSFPGSLQCDQTHACKLVVKLDVNNGPPNAVFLSQQLQYGNEAGTFTSLPPARILDTRFNVGLAGAFAPQQTRNLAVTGVGGVPSVGVDAVVMNVAVTAPTKYGWLTLFPADASLPVASNLNFQAGETVPNLVTVKVGHGGANEGKVSINNTGGNADAGSVQVIADVVGFFTDASVPQGSRFIPTTPTWILDTRFNQGLSGAFGPQQTRDLQVGGVAGVPANADAVVMNVTVTAPTKYGWLTLFPAGLSLPTASNLNFQAGQTVPNLVTVKLGVGGAVSINNTGGNAAAGTVQVIADVNGYFIHGLGSVLHPIAPQRILDTRFGTGGVTGPVGPQATINVEPHTASGIPAAGSYSAVIVNIAATGPTAYGWLTVFPSDESLPTAANLNFIKGQTVPNLVMVKVGADGKFKINNTGGNSAAGSVQIIADIVGYYTYS